MLKYGFDFADTVSAQIDATKQGFEINSTSGTVLTSSSAELFYNIQSSLPVLQTFERLNGSSSYESDDATIGYYQSFTFDSGSGKSGSFYGQQLRYQFNEEVSVVGEDSSDLEAYTIPTNAYYITGSNSADGNTGADLLAYTATTYTDSQLPNADPSTDLINNNNGYGPLVTSGSLLQSASGSLDPLDDTWYHLAYLTIDENDFVNEASIHEYSVRYDSVYHSAAAAKVPELFGDVKSYNSSNFAGTYFADEDGNPARLVPAWFNSSNSPGTQQLTFDTKAPELLSATALNVSDSDSDGNEDNYAGTFGTTGDTATFTFELVFSEQLSSPTDLANALVWTIDSTHNTTGAAVTDLAPDPQVSAPDEGTDSSGDPIFTYTVTNAVSGLFDTTGKYHIELDDSNPLTDSSGTSIDFNAANEVLGANNPTLCFFGTCLYSHAPATLTAASVFPSLVSVIGEDSSAFNEFNLTLSFSEPVLFTPDQTLTSTTAAQDAFTMDYTLISNPNNSITQIQTGQTISTDTFTDTIIAPLYPVGDVTEDNGISYYSQYVVQFDDDIGLWARDNYGTTIGESSEVTIYFNDIATAARATDSSGSVLNINYLENFLTIDGAHPTILSTSAVNEDNTEIFMVDPTNDQNVITKLKYQLITQIPEVAAITAVAADQTNSQAYNSSSPVARHVEFQIDKLDPTLGDGIGILFLFRTTDNNFTNNDSSTAPYYGAEGGIYISGADIDSSGTGYHICPPFSKHLDRIGTGMQHTDAPTYNANRMKIHYLPIPYAADSDLYIYNDTEIAALTSIAADFTGSLDTTEPCVRTAFYNDGTGQYGYVVDSDMEEQHMVIANAMLQDTHGDTADLAMLPTDQLEHVYFDLYSKDYYNDSWRKDHKITAEDLLTDLSFNINSDALHNTDDLTFQIAEDAFSIFASRFVNTINARFLDSVFLDDFTNIDIPAYSQDWLDKHAEFESDPAYANVQWESAQYGRISDEDDYLTPNYRNQTPDVLVDKNDNRLVLSIGVHPAAIWVTAGSGFFQPFESNQANFLKMNPAFYGLYYGGVANTTEPAFDYTSRHLAYVNFDLVYELTIDDQTQEITGATLVQIVSPFTLLKHSFFSSSELQDRQTYGETYTAVAASIADNVFRHNFTGTNSNDTVQHFLPYGVYCRLSTSSPSNSACYNSHAQMLLPDPDDTGNHARTISSPHNLHRGVLYLENTTAYSPDSSSNDTLGSSGGPALLQRFMRLQADHDGSADGSRINASTNPYTPGAIGANAYSTMLYNSFNRDHAHHYTYNSSSEDFDKIFAIDDDYATPDGYEQQYWGLSPFAESPDARADQILPNAFFLGFPLRNHYHHNFTVQPYQHTSFVQQINSALGESDYLFNKNTYLRGLHTSLNHIPTDMSWAGANSFNVYPSFMFPSKFDEHRYGDGSTTPVTLNEQRSSFNFYEVYTLNGRHQVYFPNIFDEPAHILGVFPHTQENTAFYRPLESQDYDMFLFQAAHAPQYHSGRSPGYSSTYTSFAYAVYALGEQLALRPDLSSYYGHGMLFRSADGASYPRGSETELMPVFQSTNHDGTHYAGVIESDVLYDGGNIQRMFLPHHLDDFDFDRGQILANKLGFFVDTGHTMDSRTSGDDFYGYDYSRLFFPSDPTIVTTETATTDYIAKRETRGKGTVTSYYPLVLANESLHTADSSWPLLLTSYPQGSHHHFEPDSDRAYRLDGITPIIGSADHALKLNNYSKSTGHLPITLDKIFPEGYRYQLGFVNREELFMYDPSVGNGDSSSDPVISRFYSSAVGHFGYATQYSRLNRRSMQGYHLSTSSQFLGDHLARFATEPSLGSGAHTPSNLSTVFDHTPVNQGATGTNYGSYGEGHYDLSTTAEQVFGGTWRHRTYQGNLRGYVLEMRTHPIENNFYEEIQGTGASSLTFPSDGNGLTDMNSLNGQHPDGNP